MDEVADGRGQQRVLGQAGEARKVGDGAERDHEIVSLERHLVALAAETEHRSTRERVDRLDLSRVDRDAGQDLPQWDQHVLGLQDAGDDLRHQPMPDFDVLPTDDGDIDLVAYAPVLDQLAGATDPGVPAGEDQYSFG